MKKRLKKAIAFVGILALVGTMTACGAKQQKEEPVGMANPMVEYKSLDEINEKVGCNLIHPGVMGVTDEKFFVISDQVAEYDFTLNGNPYTFRAAKTTDDISGIYVDGKTVFAEEPVDEKLCVMNAEKYMVGRWFDGDIQYTFAKECTDGNLNQENFTSICTEMIATTCPEIGGFFNNISGCYSDSIAHRANLEIMSFGNYATAKVSWSSSASEADFWNMTLVKDGDRYAYSDGMHQRGTFTETGESYETIAENLAGYFEKTDAGLVWSGTTEESAKDTVFEWYAPIETEPVADMENPWTEADRETVKEATGIDLATPADATDIVYMYMAENKMAQVSYTLDGNQWVYRGMPAEELQDISGKNYEWDLQESGKVKDMEAQCLAYSETAENKDTIDNAFGVQVVNWYDSANKIVYSLSVEGNDINGLDIQVMAEELVK